MSNVWRIGVGVELRMMEGAGEPRGGAEMGRDQAASLMRWALDDGLRGRAMLLDIAEALTGFAPSPRARIETAHQIVKRGLDEGRLRAYVLREHYEGGGKGPDAEAPVDRPPPVREDKTFVAIQLLSDEAEPKPVPFKRYRVVLPDQSVREGQLDQFGKAVIVGIDPGSCLVSFPDFDASEWKAA